MRKFISITALLACALFALSSCTEKFVTSGEQYLPPYTYIEATCTQVILTPGESTFQIPVHRVHGQGTLTANVTMTPADNRIQIEPGVSFADGVKEGYIKGTYNINDWAEEESKVFTFTIGDRNYNSLLGNAKKDIEVGRLIWQSLGTQKFHDAFLFDGGYVSYGYYDDAHAYDVEVQANVAEPGLFKWVRPYVDGKHSWVATGEYDPTADHDIFLDATDPQKVVMQTYHSTINWGDGEMVMGVKEGVFGTLLDGVITFPTNGLFFTEGAKTVDANQHGTFKMVVR